MNRLSKRLSDGSEYDESEDVLDFNDTQVPNFLLDFPDYGSDIDGDFMEDLERRIDEHITSMDDEELGILDEPYDDEDMYSTGDDWDDDR